MTKTSVRVLLLFVGLQLFAFLQAQQGATQDQRERVTVLSHVRLIDGTGQPPIEDVSLTIRDGSIVSIEKGSAKAPAGARVIDYSGMTVIPGLINAHGHLGLVCGDKNGANCYQRDNVLQQLRQYERYGVTSVLSLGVNRDLLYEIRDQQRAGKLDGAAVYSADRGIGVAGAAPPLPHAADQLYTPRTAEEARADVDATAARHADMVKIWVDDLHGTKPKMPPAVYSAVLAEARLKKLRVAAHVYYLADAKALVDDGVRVLAHSVRDQPVDEELISAMKQREVFYIPTLTVDSSSFIYGEHPEWKNDPFFRAAISPGLLNELTSEAAVAKMKQDPSLVMHKHDFAMDRSNLKRVYDAGVKVGFGTDSGAIPSRIPGFAEHVELEMMVQAGLSPMQAIVCATKTNAELLGVDTTTGTLAVGKRADLVVLAGNPLDDIKNTRNIAAVWHEGREVSTPHIEVRSNFRFTDHR